MKFILKKSHELCGGVGRSPSLTSLFSSVKGSLFSYFSSKFLILKKSFTLVELSIVLLVLALLVSTLLVGRQIIDRAKVQQIVSEIDYYTKNFQMFRDQYDFLPGALDEAHCRKYPEFSMQPGTDKSKYPSQCDDPDAMIAMSTNKYYTSYKQANFSIVDMVKAGLIENRSHGERRRFIYSTTPTSEVVCTMQRKVKGGYMNIDSVSGDLKFGHIDWTKMSTNLWFSNEYEGKIYWTDSVFSVISPGPTICDTNLFGGASWKERCGKIPYDAQYLSEGDNINYCGARCNCASKNSTCQVAYIAANKWSSNDTSIFGYVPLSTWGLSVFDNDNYADEICTEQNVATKRIGYMIEEQEIYNQANNSTIGDKIWITYSSGNVDQNQTYGIGGSTNYIKAIDNNVIVYFLFDPSKSYVQADGAVGFDLYDLLNKKINGKSETVGSLIALSRSSGDGFNFAYAMR